VLPAARNNTGAQFFYALIENEFQFPFNLERRQGMCLAEVKKGQRVAIVTIADADIRTQFIRFGIREVLCNVLKKSPSAPS
jgi:hypothetical protein